MRLIQPALLLMAAAALVLYLRYFRSVLLDRVLALGIFALIVLAVLFPGITVQLANLVGVGRGTDLVFYLFAIGSLFVFVLLYSKITSTEARITELVRALAIENARCFQADNTAPKRSDS